MGPVHVLLKWNADREPRTIDLHRDLAERIGYVWWGRFAQPGAPGVSAEKIGQLRSQIAKGTPTFAFLYRRGDAWRTRLEDVTSNPADVDPDHLPDYYTVRECNAFFRIRDFEQLPQNWVVNNLQLRYPSGSMSGALGNQTTPLFVQFVEGVAQTGQAERNTFLNTWSGDEPEGWPDFEDAVAASARRQPVDGRWSVGSRTGGIRAGDRAFMLRQRRERGIVASGTFLTGEVVTDKRWDGSGRLANYADVRWDTVLPLADRLPLELVEDRIPGAHWTPQGSGTQLPREAAERLEALWLDHLQALRATAPETKRSTDFWWVNQGAAYREQRDGGLVWAPLLTQGGASRTDWRNVNRLRAGDMILHYSVGQIRAVGTVRTDPQPAPVPKALSHLWSGDGFKCAVSYRELLTPIDLSAIPNEWRVTENVRTADGPFDRTGGVKQGYLWRLASEFVEQLFARFPELGGGAVMVDDFEEQWRGLTEYLTAHPLWQTLAENVAVFDVEASNERIMFRTNESKDVRTIYRGEFESHYRRLKGDGQLPRTWDTAKMACLALLPNVEYSLNPLTLHWVEPPSHALGEIRQHALVVVPAQPLDLEWLETQTLWSKAELEELVEAVRNKSFQLVLAGPPGTGKTWVAKHLARFLTQDSKPVVRTVQFQPSYSYEEFVEGLRPDADERGVITFRPVPGVLLRFVNDVGDDPGPHILLIDEMNRANLPKVLGELMYLFEYRDEEIDLRYRTNFKLPTSVRFLGTMNTADRSIRSIDTALRRRFDFFECPPRRDILERYYERRENRVANLLDGFEKLNEALKTKLDRHHTVGHTFFMTGSMTRPVLERVWKHKIAPLIEEYFFDQPDVAADFAMDTFWP